MGLLSMNLRLRPIALNIRYSPNPTIRSRNGSPVENNRQSPCSMPYPNDVILWEFPIGITETDFPTEQ